MNAEENVAFLKEQLLTVKTEKNLVKMELDKCKKKYTDKEREVEESKRLYEIEVGKLRIKEEELRETSASLSVYQQLDNNTRLTSLVDDVEPELLRTKDLK